MTLKAQKRPNTQPNVIQHRSKATALCPLNQTLLFQTAMVHLNPPRRESEFLALRLAHLGKVRRPVFRCAVCGANPKYFDFSKSFEPADCPVAAAQPGFRDCLQFARADSDLAVRLEPGQKMPATCANQFEVLNRSIPAIETHQFGIKPALKGGKQHFCEMVIFGFAVAVFIK